MLDEFEKVSGKKDPGMITGKPQGKGGIVGRDTATAQGGVYVLDYLLKTLGHQGRTLRVAVQGFGNAGATIAQLLFAQGFSIVGISDSSGALLSPDGIDPGAALATKKKTSSLEYTGAGQGTNKELLECDCDVLIPAALDNQLTEENAARVQAKIILELANGPTTPEADAIFSERGIVVIPDVLANAGGVTVSYFEWLQNKEGSVWSEQNVQEQLQEVMRHSAASVYEMSTRMNISLRESAFLLGVERIVEAEQARDIT